LLERETEIERERVFRERVVHVAFAGADSARFTARVRAIGTRVRDIGGGA
jgi:hypothetical protein